MRNRILRYFVTQKSTKRTAGDVIREAMNLAGVGQSDVCRAAGVSQSYLSLALSGKWKPQRPDNRQWVRLCRALGIDPLDALGGTLSPIQKRPADEARALIDQLDGTSLLDAAVAMLQGLVDNHRLRPPHR